MKRFWIWLVIVLVVGFLIAGWYGKAGKVSLVDPASLLPVPLAQTMTPLEPKGQFIPPLDRARERVTKKKFGEYYKDRFQGYHTGTDFEIFPEETDSPVSIHTICSGKLHLKEFAAGYGGLVVQDCTLDGEPITVVYGHLRLTSVSRNQNENLVAGEVVGLLGAAYSRETDGERKHLHLGIHKGSSIDIRGYVASPPGLSSWLDPCPDDKMAQWNICSQ